MKFVISIADQNIVSDVIQMFEKDSVSYITSIQDILINNAHKQDIDIVSLLRKDCAEYHMENMDNYFEEAESDGSLKTFWSDDSEFYEMFKNLNLENIIELAVGRGRHVQKYEKNASNITLVDILEKNINYCKNRFKDKTNISYYKNNGFNLEELASDTYTSLFTYDAMVHFEMMDINEYLIDIKRVLKQDGFALFHHSNNNDYKASFVNAQGGRNFMSKELFAHLAYRAGFEVVEQRVIDWGGS